MVKLKVLVIGDVIGKPGRTIVEKYLKKVRSDYDLILLNGENSAGGFGITDKIADGFFKIGIDVITSGNHIWDKKSIYSYLESEHRLLRPLNYPMGVPGVGRYIIEKCNKKIAIINIQGKIFMPPIDCPFQVIKQELEELQDECDIVIVDFHAEASSEKIAMGYLLDGKVSLVYGTHTHVLTADNKILKNGTGCITDIGMTGGMAGVIGMEKENIVEKFLNALPAKFEVCKENIRLNGIAVEIDEESGECLSVERIDLPFEEL